MAPSNPVKTVATKSVSPATPKHRDLRSELLWLIVPSILFANAFWYITAQIFNGLSRVGAAEILWRVATLLLSFGLMLGIALLVPYLVSHHWLVGLIMLLTGLNVLWYLPLTWLTGLMVVAVTGGLWLSAVTVGRDLRDRIKINIHGTLVRNTSWAVLGVMLAVTLAQYQVIDRALGPNKSVDQLVTRTVAAVEKILPRFVKNYQPDMSLAELVGAEMPTADKIMANLKLDSKLTTSDQTKLQQQLKDQGIENPNLPALGASAAQVRQAIDAELAKFQAQASSEMLTGLSDQLHVKLGTEKTTHDIITAILRQKLSPAALRFTAFIPPLVAVALFLLLRLFSPIFEILVVVSGWLWYRLLRLARVFNIRIETVEAERLIWHNPN